MRAFGSHAGQATKLVVLTRHVRRQRVPWPAVSACQMLTPIHLCVAAHSFLRLRQIALSVATLMLLETVAVGFAKDSSAPDCFPVATEAATDAESLALIQLVIKITTLVGLTPNFQLCIVDEPTSNAYAASYPTKGRHIVITRALLDDLNAAPPKGWLSIGILSHEIGHHLQGHLDADPEPRDARKDELEADRFAGFVLGRLSAPLEDVKAEFSQFFPEAGSAIHPYRQVRLDEIEIGWRQGVASSSPWISHLGRILAACLIGLVIAWLVQRVTRSRRHIGTSGMSELHCVRQHPDGATGDIVFVHGLGGHWRATWECDARQPNTFWPEWLSSQVPQVNVWSLQYGAQPSGWNGVGRMSIIEHADNVLELMATKGLGSRPTVFVAHSLGGLLVKNVLRASKEAHDHRARRVGATTHGVAFFATPNSGALLASFVVRLLSWLGPIGQLPWIASVVHELRAHSAELRRLNQWYRDHVMNSPDASPRTKVYYEKQGIFFGSILVVDEASADPGLPGIRPVPVAANHFSICKFSARDNWLYENVKQFIQECLNDRQIDQGPDRSPH